MSQEGHREWLPAAHTLRNMPSADLLPYFLGACLTKHKSEFYRPNSYLWGVFDLSSMSNSLAPPGPKSQDQKTRPSKGLIESSCRLGLGWGKGGSEVRQVT